MQKHNLTNNWGIGYGVAYRYAKDYDFQTYNNVTGNIQTENTEAKLNEQTASFYFSLNKNWATGTSFSVSATGEYYTIGNYHKWAVYPQASLTYLKSPKHIFQLSLSGLLGYAVIRYISERIFRTSGNTGIAPHDQL